MAYRTLEVTLLSAKDLKRVNLISRMEVYAVVTISGDPLTRQCTQPDPYGGRHPCWNTSFRFNVPPNAATATGCLHVLLRTERALGDRDVGEVIVPLADILAGGGSACDPGSRPPQLASYQVRKVHRCEPRGVLNVSYRLGPIVAPQQARPAVDEAAGTFVGYPVPRQFYQPPYAYLPSQLSLAPPPPPAQAAGHVDAQLHGPPPYSLPAATYPQAAATNYPHQAGATYPQQAAAGRAAQPPPASGESNGKLDFGVGLGAGLVSGAIGGMMVASDVMMYDAAAYNSGYRAGLADGGAAAAYKNSYRVHDKVEAKRTAV